MKNIRPIQNIFNVEIRREINSKAGEFNHFTVVIQEKSIYSLTGFNSQAYTTDL